MRYSNYERPLTFFDILGSIFRYKWRVLCVSFLVLCLCVVGIFLFPKKYESEAKLFVRLGRGSASLDPATIGQTISIQESREAEMNSIVDMLESRGLAERIVTKIGYERILKKYAWAEVQLESWTDYAMEAAQDNIPALVDKPSEEGGLTSDEIKARKDYELAVKELASNLKIDSPKKSNTIEVVYRARTPELAYDVVQAVVDSYQRMHIEAYQSGDAFDFFDEQFDAQRKLVSEAEETLRTAKNKNAVVTVAGKQESLQTQITEIKKLELETKADLSASEAKVAELRAELQRLPREMMSEKTLGMARNDTDSMRDRLYQLEIEERDLAAKYVSTHPELLRVRDQLRNARQIVDSQPQNREQSVIAVNPVRMDLERETHLAEAEVARLSAKVDAIATLEIGLMERLANVNDLEVEAFEMQRLIDIARRNHDSYAQKLEESRIKAALDREAVSNVSVVGEPSIRYKHASPKRSILGLLAIILSAFSGISVALASDYSANAREMRHIRDAERTRYLQELEREKEVRTITAGEHASNAGGAEEFVDESSDSSQLKKAK